MLTCQRALFSLPVGLHYLNAAYMGPLSKATQEAGIRGICRKAVPSEITADDFFSESDEARRRFARLVNAPDPTSIAIIPAASYGIAVAARNVAARPGQHVVLTEAQFPSNVYPWRALCRRKGLTLRTVAAPDVPNRGEEWNRRILDAIDESTAVIAMPHVHWTDGTLFDLEQIGARARAAGAALVVDATQSVGALPFDVGRVQPDALVVASYKFLLGPYSLGCAYFGPRFSGGEPLEETWLGRVGSEDFAGLVDYRDEYQPGALRYDMGERSNLHLMPMLVSALGQALSWGAGEVQAYCRALSEPLSAQARRLGFVVEDARFRAGHLFGLRAPAGLDLQRLHARLQECGVFVSRRGAALRVSPHVYNDEGDMAALGDALRAAV